MVVKRLVPAQLYTTGESAFLSLVNDPLIQKQCLNSSVNGQLMALEEVSAVTAFLSHLMDRSHVTKFVFIEKPRFTVFWSLTTKLIQIFRTITSHSMCFDVLVKPVVMVDVLWFINLLLLLLRLLYIVFVVIVPCAVLL